MIYVSWFDSFDIFGNKGKRAGGDEAGVRPRQPNKTMAGAYHV